MKKNYLKGTGCLMVACLIWGLSFTLIKVSVSRMPAIAQIALRFSIAAITVLLVCWKKMKNAKMEDIRCGFWMGAASFIAFIFQNYAFVNSMASKVAFLTAGFVIFTPLLEWIYKKKRPNGRYFVGAFICLAGMAVMSLNADFTINKGDILAVLGAVFFAIHIIQTGEFTKTRDPICITGFSFFFIAGFAIIVSLIVERGVYHLQIIDIGNGLFLGVLATFAAYSLQSIGQKYLPSAVAAIILSLESVFGCIFAVLLLKEEMTARILIGSILIFCSILLVQVNFKKGEEGHERIEAEKED